MCTFVLISNFCQNEVKKKAGGQSQDPLLLVFVTCGDKCSLFLAGAGVVDFCSNLQLPPKRGEASCFVPTSFARD